MSLAIIERQANGVVVAQRQDNGFINGTAMCVAHSKDISDWLKTDDTWELVVALANDLGIKPKDRKSGNSMYTRVAATYPDLVVVKRGSPETGGGTWIHPDLAIQLAQWCNKAFAIQVSRWVREWMLTGSNPVHPLISPEFATLADEFFELIGQTHTLIHRWSDFARRLNEEIKTVRKSSELQRYADRLEKMLEIVNGIISLGSPATQVERSLVSAQMAKLIEEKFIANSTQTGCLERYTSRKPDKSGVVVEYPKTNAIERDESVDEDWWWRYRFSVKDPVTGKWKAKSKSVKLDKLPAVRAAIALDATLPTILRLIEE